MLYTVAIIVLGLWLLSILGGYLLGAFTHVLLVIAFVLILAGFIGHRTPT